MDETQVDAELGIPPKKNKTTIPICNNQNTITQSVSILAYINAHDHKLPLQVKYIGKIARAANKFTIHPAHIQYIPSGGNKRSLHNLLNIYI